MLVVDLFCGMGGLSYGFSKLGFQVKGYDLNRYTQSIFKENEIGHAEALDLSKKWIKEKPDILIGGPPCRPWSTINVKKRLNKHEDYKLLNIFFKNIVEKSPRMFIMENVIPVKNDLLYNSWIELLTREYSITNKIIKYDEFGASTKRRRLITIGIKDVSSPTFFTILEKYKKKPKTVRDAIEQYLNLEKGEFPDHIWPDFKTIKKYEKNYREKKYGWYKLKMDEPAPSFGNVMKAYTLHPFAGDNGYPLRVISVREAMSIMGFSHNFKFPVSIGHTIKYQMIADVVSPIFSIACASTVKEILN